MDELLSEVRRTQYADMRNPGFEQVADGFLMTHLESDHQRAVRSFFPDLLGGKHFPPLEVIARLGINENLYLKGCLFGKPDIGAFLKHGIQIFRHGFETGFEQLQVFYFIQGVALQYAGGWITEDMIKAYIRLHKAGYAHSVEAWDGDEIAGGLYDVEIGRTFFGESMFAKKTDASKVAFAVYTTDLANKGFELIDCQVTTEHLIRFGAREVPRADFMKRLQKALDRD